MKFGLRLAFGLLGTAKALSVDDIFAHVQPQIQGNSAASLSLSSVAGALANMAAQSPASSSTVQSIKDYISQMLADITTQHNIAQAELTDVSGYSSCDTKMAGAMKVLTTPAPTTTSTTTLLTTTLAPTSAELEQCLAEIAKINGTMITCESELTAVRSASEAVCTNFHYKTVAEAKAERCNDTFAGTYEQYLERDVKILEDYVAKKQNCTSYLAQSDAKSSECANLRTSLNDKQIECSKIVVVTTTMFPTTTQQGQTAEEKAQCDNYHKKVEACSDYDSCYESVDLAKIAEKESATTLEASRTNEWISLKRMICLVDVIGTTDQTTKITACMSKAISDYNTSHLELTLPAAPAKQACGPFDMPATCAQIQPVFPFVLSGGIQFAR